MAQNPTVTTLDFPQVIQRTFDAANDAVRMSMGATDLVIVGEALAASGTINSTSSGQAIAATACPGIKEFQVYLSANTITAATVTVRIDVSPDPTANTSVWYQTSTTLSLSAGAAGVVAVSSILNTLIAQQVRVTITANGLTDGETVTCFLAGNSF